MPRLIIRPFDSKKGQPLAALFSSSTFMRDTAALSPSLLWLGFLGAGWLVPNHYSPWLSAWGEAVPLFVIASAVLFFGKPINLHTPWCAFASVCIASIATQLTVGKLSFGGDAWIVTLYLLSFIAAIAIGDYCADDLSKTQSRVGLILAGGLFCCAYLSVVVALVQWTTVFPLGLLGVDMPPGARPFGNVGQPNHLASICFIGLVALAILREQRHIGAVTFWFGSVWLLSGAVMSGSRTAWLQAAFFGTFVFVYSRRASLSAGRWDGIAIIATFVALQVAWPLVNQWSLIGGERPISDVTSGGTRPLHWTALAEAVKREPLWGYGWQQVSAAQVRLADEMPHVGEHIEHSHNIFLDLLIWNGIPIGLALIAWILYWFLSRALRVREPIAAWMLLGVACVFIHGLLEYPLEYAYFLIPLGVFIGVVDALDGRGSELVIPPVVARMFGVGLLAMLTLTAHDYLKAEEAYRTVRLESARIGATGLTTPPPDLRVLTQLEAFLRFIHTPAGEGMTTAQLDWMRRVSERFAYPPALFRYALAMGLNGQPEAAALALRRICKMHPIPRCLEARIGWEAAIRQHPQLERIAIPDLPRRAPP